MRILMLILLLCTSGCITGLLEPNGSNNVDKLREAIMKADAGKVDSYLAKGIDPDVSDPDAGGAYRLFNLAVEQLISTQNHDGMEEKYFEVLSVFCKYDVNINGPQMSTLIDATQAEHVKLIKFLIDNGANIDIFETDPFSGKKNVPFDIAFNRNRPDIVLLFLENGLKIENSKGQALLNDAINKNWIQMVDVLLTFKVDPNYDSGKKDYPILKAAKKGYSQIVSLLAQAGADINCKNSYDDTALMLAASNKQVDAAAVLINQKAELDLPDKYGRTALFLAAGAKQPEIVKLLLDAGADYTIVSEAQTPVTKSLQLGDSESVGYFLEAGLDPNGKSVKGDPYLNISCDKNDFESLKLLVEKGADVNAVNDFDMRRPIYYAVTSGNIEMVEYLLSKNVNLNFKVDDSYGHTPLSYAIHREKAKIAKLLLEKGADISIKTDYGNKTAIDYAKMRKRQDLIELLEKYRD